MTSPTVLAACALVLAGCAGSGGNGAAKRLPDCIAATDSDTARAALPADLPLPEGAVLEKQTTTSGGTLLVEGFVPGSLEENVSFFRDRLPEAGYALGDSEAEEHDAEQRFAGNGSDGYLKLRTVGGCNGALALAVALTDR